MINGLDLFSGIGGISLALSPWVRTIAYCEIDSYAQSVLLSRMSDGQISTAPIWPDVTTLVPGVLPRNGIDLISGGFPCQDISIARDGEGLEGERSGLFFEVVRITRELRPEFVFLENVPAITSRGGLRVIGEFAALGYECRWTIVSAREFGAPHLRRRWFFLAHTNGAGLEVSRNASTSGEKAFRPAHATATDLPPMEMWDQDFSDVSRMDDGLPIKTHRIRALGNAVVPIQAREAFKKLMGLEAQAILEGVR